MSYLVLIHQIIAHLALLGLLVYFPVKYWVVTFAMYFILYCFGGTITYHRLLSHNSFKAPVWFYYLGSILGLLACAGSPIAWVATHKKHHRFSDKKNDPHSMLFKKWFQVQWLSMLEPAEVKYATHLLRSQFQLFLHRHYFTIHLSYAAILALVDFKLLIYFYLAPAALVWEGGSVINTICHKWGYSNYPLEDQSRNNHVVAWLTFGEGFHNNHHAKQTQFEFSRNPNEFDIGGFFIKLIRHKA